MLIDYNASEKKSIKQTSLLEKRLRNDDSKKINRYTLPEDLKTKIQNIVASASTK